MGLMIIFLVIALFLAFISGPTNWFGWEKYNYVSLWRRFVAASIFLAIMFGGSYYAALKDTERENKKPSKKIELKTKTCDWEVRHIYDVFGDDTGEKYLEYEDMEVYKDKIIITCPEISIAQHKKVIMIKNQMGQTYETKRRDIYHEDAIITTVDDNYERLVSDLKKDGILKYAYPNNRLLWTSWRVDTDGFKQLYDKELGGL